MHVYRLYAKAVEGFCQDHCALLTLFNWCQIEFLEALVVKLGLVGRDLLVGGSRGLLVKRERRRLDFTRKVQLLEVQGIPVDPNDVDKAWDLLPV